MIPESFVYKIYNDISRFDFRVKYIPKADCLQEIRIAGLSLDIDSVYKRAHNLIYRLLSDYGYSEKKGKDNFAPFYQNVEFSENEQAVFNQIEKLYLNENRTAREVASIFDIEYNNKFQKILHQCFPKNMGKGGYRKNSGAHKQLKIKQNENS